MGKCIAFIKNMGGVMTPVKGATKWPNFLRRQVLKRLTPAMNMV